MNTLLAQRLYLIDLTKSCCTYTGLDTVRSGKSSQTLRRPSPLQFLKKWYNIKGATIYIWDFFNVIIWYQKVFAK